MRQVEIFAASVLGWASGLRYSDLLPLCRCPSMPQHAPVASTNYFHYFDYLHRVWSGIVYPDDPDPVAS